MTEQQKANEGEQFVGSIIDHSQVGQVVKKSTCNAGGPSSFPGSGSSPGEGIGYLLQYSWASLVAQTIKDPPAMREDWIQSFHWEDPLEEGMATHSSILAWRIPTDRGAWWATVSPWPHKESDTIEQLSTVQHNIHQHLPHPLIYTTEIFSFLSTREMYF